MISQMARAAAAPVALARSTSSSSRANVPTFGSRTERVVITRHDDHLEVGDDVFLPTQTAAHVLVDAWDLFRTEQCDLP